MEEAVPQGGVDWVLRLAYGSADGAKSDSPEVCGGKQVLLLFLL